MKNKKQEFDLTKVLTVSAAHLTHDMFTAFLAPVLPLLINKFGLSYLNSSILNIVRKIPSLLSLLLGSIVSRLDEKYIHYLIVAAPLVTSILMSLLGVVPSYPILVLLLLLVGFSSSIFHILAPAIIRKVSGEQIGQGISFYQLGGEAARTIGPLIILSAVSHWGLEGSYRLIILGVIVSWFLYLKIRDIEMGTLLEKKAEHKQFSIKEIVKQYHRFILKLGGIRFFWSLTQVALTLFLPTYLKTVKGTSLLISGGGLSVLQLAGAFGTYFGGVLSDKIGRKKTITAAVIGAAVALGFFSVVDGWLLLPLLIILGFCIFAISPIILALVLTKNSQQLIKMNSFYKTISFISTAVATLIIGQGADLLGLALIYKILPFTLLLSLGLILKINN